MSTQQQLYRHVAETSPDCDPEDYRKQLEDLRQYKKTLEGKIKGYHYLGNKYREKDEECQLLKQHVIEVTQKLSDKDRELHCVHPSDKVTTSEKTIQTSLHLLHGINDYTLNGPVHTPSEALMQTSTNTINLFGNGPRQGNSTAVADDCLFDPIEKATNQNKMSSNPSTVDSNRLFSSNANPGVYGAPGDGVSYPPGDGVSYPPGDGVMYPPNFVRQESQPFQNHDIDLSNTSPVMTNDAPARPANTQHPELAGYDIPTKASLNLMDFEDKVLYPHSEGKDQESPSEILLSIQVHADLVTDGPNQNIRKYVQDQLLPMLQKQEEDSKNKEDRWNQEKSELLRKIHQLEIRDRKAGSPVLSLSEPQAAGWDVVHRTEAVRTSYDAEHLKGATSAELKERMKILENHNKELEDANRAWKMYHEKCQTEQQKNAEYYRQKFEQMTQEILRMKAQDEQKRADFQKMLFEAKQKQVDEETLAEEVNHYKTRVQVLEAELERIRPGHLHDNMNALCIAGTAAQPPFNILPDRNLQEVQEENDTLRCQVTLFQEDFERERNDRAQAHHAKEELKTKLDTMKQELKHSKDQLKQFQRQVQQAEANCNRAYVDKDSLQQQVTDLKNTLRREKEANALRLQMPFQHVTPNPVYPGGPVMNGTQHLEPNRVAAQPQTDPYAQPVPPFMVSTNPRPTVPQGPPQPPQAFNNYQRASQTQQPGEWQCDRCTLSNHPSRTICEACGHQQIFSQSRQGVSPQPLYRRGYNPEQVEPCEAVDLSTDTGDFTQN